MFHNKSLAENLKLAPSEITYAEDSSQTVQWSQFIRRATLENKAFNTLLSIISIAQNRYSEQLLSKVHQRESNSESCDLDKTLTVQRNEIVFNNKSSVLLNFRKVQQDE